VLFGFILSDSSVFKVGDCFLPGYFPLAVSIS
jgi:hypothetical protein